MAISGKNSDPDFYYNRKCKFCDKNISYPDYMRQQGNPPYATVHKCAEGGNLEVPSPIVEMPNGQPTRKP